MEALSPRDANARVRILPPTQKAKVASAISAKREKDHPPPPPSEVREPPSSDRRDGAVYHTGRLLGKGGFAICYEGELGSTRQKFALKMVKSHMPQKKMQQKFQTELQIHSKMRHSSIVHFHRAFTFQECTYIVLELCPNGSLMDVIKKREFMTEPEVRFYTIQMAGGIKYMHAKGIIHRDLKMGNIFLDKDMNIKIGDFGLAALLMSGKDMSACRRTTLCGTPNYIAPEILEKSKKGHDHAVDIWSLGIIIFAMLTGKPPFQSSTAEEIYRRAREREYDWPKLDTSENYFCQQAKDLVSSLLVDPEDRPDPDTIVQHPFFSCGWVPRPDEMLPKFTELAPSPNHFPPAGTRTGRASSQARNLKNLCVMSAVGPYSSTKKMPSSTYREMAAEEKAGLTPAVPLPENVVYRPFAEWLDEHAQRRKNDSESNTKSRIITEPEEPALSLPVTRPTPTHRSVQQSFAAQQRAQNQPASASLMGQAQRLRASPINDQKSQRLRQPIEGLSHSHRTLQVPAKQPKLTLEPPGSLVPKAVAAIEARIGTDLVQQLNQASLERQPREEVQPVVSARPLSLFSERESPEFLPRSKPEQILQSLKSFHAELERALNSRSIPPTSRPPVSSPAIVVKWVDYTNKFGLGYILNNGSVGCIFRSSLAASGSRTGRIPPTCVIVRNAERHLQSRGNESYPDRHQLVPISGPPIEFYEHKREEGIARVNVNPRKFSVTPGKDGEQGKLSRGKDEHDDRKCEKIVLWNKFAKYMIAFGRDQDCPIDDALMMTNESGSGTVVTFYQRFGDVGCWYFNDGSFQFNFPDHTKIILSAGGTWCDFYHLPLEAARDLAQTGSLPASALDDRQHLCYPLQTLLNFMAKPKASRTTGRARASPPPPINPLLQGIPNANHFRAKIEFIRDIAAEWIRNGGLGNSDMEPAGRLRWNGLRELHSVKVPYKHVWVTIGARDGDDRRVAWFDPKRPLEVVPDIVT